MRKRWKIDRRRLCRGSRVRPRATITLATVTLAIVVLAIVDIASSHTPVDGFPIGRTGPAVAAEKPGSRARPDGARAKGLRHHPLDPVVVEHDISRLPPAVADMRSAILAAIEAGDIDVLRDAIEVNELKPELGAPPGTDAITFLKAQSGDGQGREMLAILGRLLDSPWAVIPGGRDVENGRIYVWPAFAEVPLGSLRPADEVSLYRLVTPAEATAMRSSGRWTWWRLAIGADGVWHSFARAR